MIAKEFIVNQALAAGFNCCGTARCRPLQQQKEFFYDWLSRGYNSGLDYLSRNIDKRFDPSLLVDNAKTVIICAVSYKNELSAGSWPEGHPKIASFALTRDYHTVLKDMLGRVYDSIRERWPQVSGRCFVDSAPVLEKAWAVEAGMGWIGKNSLLITPQWGSFVVLGEIVIDAEVDTYDTPMPQNKCGECTLCIDTCPTGAIRAPRIIDTGSCIARLTIEKGDEPSPDALHGWIFGCDACQSICPHNRHTPNHTNHAFDPVIDPPTMTAAFWHAISEDDFKTHFKATPLSRAGYCNLKSRTCK